MKAENLNLQVMETTLAEWRSKIDELQEKAHLIGKENALKTDRQFDQLRERYQNLEDQLAQLKKSHEEGVGRLKARVEKSWGDLIHEFEKLTAKYQ